MIVYPTVIYKNVRACFIRGAHEQYMVMMYRNVILYP